MTTTVRHHTPYTLTSAPQDIGCLIVDLGTSDAVVTLTEAKAKGATQVAGV